MTTAEQRRAAREIREWLDRNPDATRDKADDYIAQALAANTLATVERCATRLAQMKSTNTENAYARDANSIFDCAIAAIRALAAPGERDTMIDWEYEKARCLVGDLPGQVKATPAQPGDGAVRAAEEIASLNSAFIHNVGLLAEIIRRHGAGWRPIEGKPSIRHAGQYKAADADKQDPITAQPIPNPPERG